MRFIIMHKRNAHWESGARPDATLIARVGTLIEQLVKAGAFRAGEGLRPSAEGVRVRFSEGKPSVTPGPFERGEELPAGFSILRAASIDDAVEWASRQAAILGDEEIDIRPVTEPWDIGMAPRPADLATRRYMALRKATDATEAGVHPPAEAPSEFLQLIAATTRSGLHVATETLQPSRRGRRLKNSHGAVTFFDGPMIETKELIGGYIIVDVASLDDACQWAARYIDVVGAEEVDVRGLE